MSSLTDSDLAIGVDFGGTKMLGALVDADGQIIEEHRVATPYDGDELLFSIAELVKTLESRANVRAKGVGIGAAGLVDRSGQLVFGPNVGRVSGLGIESGLRERLPDRTIRVENDNTCATWGEVQFGAGRGGSEVVFVGLGTGIGAGFVTRSQPDLGHHGFAAEVGHMTIVVNGEDCVCGKRGCWEAYASGRALGRLGRENVARGKSHRILELAGAVDDVRGEHVTQAAREGHLSAQAIMHEFARWVAIGLGNLVTILDPQIVILGGGMSSEFDLFLDQMWAALDDVMYAAAFRPAVDIRVAELGARAGVVGAAMMIHKPQ